MMTPRQFRDELIAFRDTVGKNAWISVTIKDEFYLIDEKPIYASVYPRGMTPGNCLAFRVSGEDFDELIITLRNKWAEYAATDRARTVKKMAIEIIRITHEMGECTDAALRDHFDGEEVAALGADACKEANAAADKGPFTILTLGGANGAPHHEAPSTQTRQ